MRNGDVLLGISSCNFGPRWTLARIAESRLYWFCRVCGVGGVRLPRRILVGVVPGAGGQGGPRKRWGDSVIAGSTFLEAYRNAEDENRWADFVHGTNVLFDTVQK